jgi:hypothetical protein
VDPEPARSTAEALGSTRGQDSHLRFVAAELVAEIEAKLDNA